MVRPLEEQVTANLKEVQSKGGERLRRIRDIVKDAAAQTVIEIKEGSSEIGEIAKESFVGITDTLNTEAQTAQSETVSQTPEPTTATRLQILMQAVLKLMKQRWHQTVVWYNSAKVQAEAQAAAAEPTVVDQKQAVIEARAGEMGMAIAKKELQIRHQLKEFLEATAARL